MKEVKQKHGIDFEEIQILLNNKKYVTKKELREILLIMNPSINDLQIRSVIYSLEKGNYIFSAGNALFSVVDPQARRSTLKSKFLPIPSASFVSLRNAIDSAFPYLECIFWESCILHEFMVNQPRMNMIIIETEKGYENSLFDFIQGNTSVDVFLSPNPEEIGRYVSFKNEPVIVSHFFSQSPKSGRGVKHHYARIEKILVDIFVDKSLFFPYQGAELVNIYENFYTRFIINENSLFRYAQRRSALGDLKEFIQLQTNIKFHDFQ